MRQLVQIQSLFKSSQYYTDSYTYIIIAKSSVDIDCENNRDFTAILLTFMYNIMISTLVLSARCGQPTITIMYPRSIQAQSLRGISCIIIGV